MKGLNMTQNNRKTAAKGTPQVEKQVEEADRNRTELADHIAAIFENPETPEELADGLNELLGEVLYVPSGLFTRRDMLKQMLDEYTPIRRDDEGGAR